jgi:uncharacterized alpha-E superfamily protein
MLLSRVAESVYWIGRYLERTEGMARLGQVHTELFLDLPKSAGLDWSPLLAVTGSGQLFAEHHAEATEEHVISFLAAEATNPGSILSSLARARSNFRTSREAFPTEAWRALNELHQWAEDTSAQAIDRRTRLAWMDAVVRRCQLITGVLNGIMSHDQAYAFLEIGRHFERADMTTRVLDMQAAILIGVGDGLHPYADVTWLSVLRSLSAHQMFRRTIGGGVAGPEALRFLLKHPQFPRSVEFCLTVISQGLLELPHCQAPMAICAELQQGLEEAAVIDLAQDGLHEWVDVVQVELARLHDCLSETYFRVAPADSTTMLQTA